MHETRLTCSATCGIPGAKMKFLDWLNWWNESMCGIVGFTGKRQDACRKSTCHILQMMLKYFRLCIMRTKRSLGLVHER